MSPSLAGYIQGNVNLGTGSSINVADGIGQTTRIDGHDAIHPTSSG